MGERGFEGGFRVTCRREIVGRAGVPFHQSGIKSRQNPAVGSIEAKRRVLCHLGFPPDIRRCGRTRDGSWRHVAAWEIGDGVDVLAVRVAARVWAKGT
jgi:hypothetical protein